MSALVSAHGYHWRGHWIPVNDSLYDTIRMWLFLALIVVGLFLSVASVVKWRRGKHRTEPKLREMALKVDQHEKVIRNGLAWRRKAEKHVKTNEERLEEMRQQFAEFREVLIEAFSDAGQELPVEVAPKECHLHLVKDESA